MSALIVILLLLALLLGGVGLFFEGLKWLLIIAGICIIASIVARVIGHADYGDF